MSDWLEITADQAPAWLKRAGKGVVLTPMPLRVREIVEPVLSDMQLPTPINLRVAFEPDHAPYKTGMLYVWEHAGMGASGYLMPKRDVSFADRLVGFAWFLQDQVFPETDGAWAEARPACPWHAHPGSPENLNGEALWVCPVDRRKIAPIGAVSASGASRVE